MRGNPVIPGQEQDQVDCATTDHHSIVPRRRKSSEKGLYILQQSHTVSCAARIQYLWDRVAISALDTVSWRETVLCKTVLSSCPVESSRDHQCPRLPLQAASMTVPALHERPFSRDISIQHTVTVNRIVLACSLRSRTSISTFSYSWVTHSQMRPKKHYQLISNPKS